MTQDISGTKNVSSTMTRGLAIDPQHAETVFSNLSEADGLEVASQQFEAIFLQLVLKNMNSATEAISGKDGLFGSSQQRLYQDIYNTQMAQHMASSGQVGLADQMVHQLSGALHQAENSFQVENQSQDENKLKNSENVAALTTIEGAAFAQPLIGRGPDISGED